MYRQGLGDCHLLTFNVGGDERHVLIDCGSLGSKTSGVSMSQVVADIKATTNGHLHLVIATHEHWDHVSGFNSQEAAFRQFRGRWPAAALGQSGSPRSWRGGLLSVERFVAFRVA